MEKNSVTEALRAFVAERDWSQFHSEENLAKSISIEAAELLECFQWGSEAEKDRVVDELADVLTYCLLLADKLGVDANDIVLGKLGARPGQAPTTTAGQKAKIINLVDRDPGD